MFPDNLELALLVEKRQKMAENGGHPSVGEGGDISGEFLDIYVYFSLYGDPILGPYHG